MTVEIPLSMGLVALIDDEDEDNVRRHKWHAVCTPTNRTCYAVANIHDGVTFRTVQMHRFIMSPPDDMQVDHINGEGLDNRRGNMRNVTRAQNQWNRKPPPGSTSCYKGVSWRTRSGKWIARIARDGQEIRIGAYDDEETAARAYDAKAVELFGEYARLNFPN